MSRSTSESNWIKIDLHIHTLDDPKDAVDYSAHQLLERARALGFGVLAITLHDTVFNRREVFADAAAMGILLIPAAEVRLQGADVIVLNVNADEVAQLKDFDDLRQLRDRRGDSIFTIAPHPFYLLGGSIGSRLFDEIDCFDAIEFCHFHNRIFNPNRRAANAAAQFGKPLIAASDAHQLHDFGQHYTSIPRPAKLTAENVFAAMHGGPLRLTSPPASFFELISAMYFIFLAHPFRRRRRSAAGSTATHRDSLRSLEMRRSFLNLNGKRDTACHVTRIIASLLLLLAVALTGCKSAAQKEKAKKAALTKKAKAKMREENVDLDFQAFVGRLRKAVAARDAATLRPMMAPNFGYKLEPKMEGIETSAEGPGVFKYWDEQGLWPELEGILSEKFVKKGDFWVAPPQFADEALGYDGYRAGIRRVNGSWKFAYFVNG